MEGDARDPQRHRGRCRHETSPVVDAMFSGILQIAVIDIVFSIDSIITAVGMADHVEVMIAAITVAILVMYFAAEPVAAFIERHPASNCPSFIRRTAA
ncbi:MAG: hypothetical protein WA884_09315 [Methyloceanibacter sp.]